MSVFGILLAVLAAAVFVGAVLLGAWIDGRRQALRRKGLHPVTTPEGRVESVEEEQRRGGGDIRQ